MYFSYCCVKILTGDSMAQAYISLMSNFGDRREFLNRAVWAIDSLPQTKISTVGRIYEAELQNQKPKSFYVSAVRVETELSPEMLLGSLHGIEAAMGRNRKEKSCVIDLDLLMFEDYETKNKAITLPHSEMLNRPYILAALLSIYADKEYKNRLKDLGEDNVKVTGEGLYMPL